MKATAQLDQFSEPHLRKALFYSIGLHVFIILFTIFAPWLPILKGKKGMIEYSTTIRVDIVDLPDKVIHELNKNIVSTEDAIKSIKKDLDQAYEDPDALKFRTKRDREKIKKQQVSSIEKLKVLKALEEKLKKEKKTDLKRGNVVTSGVETPSQVSGGEQLDPYRSMIQEKVKLRWALPSYLRREASLSGELIIFLDSDGNLVRKQIVSSGNPEFDEFMNRSLEESLPFPPVPSTIQKDLRYDGVSIMFYARELL